MSETLNVGDWVALTKPYQWGAVTFRPGTFGCITTVYDDGSYALRLGDIYTHAGKVPANSVELWTLPSQGGADD